MFSAVQLSWCAFMCISSRSHSYIESSTHLRVVSCADLGLRDLVLLLLQHRDRGALIARMLALQRGSTILISFDDLVVVDHARGLQQTQPFVAAWI